MRKEFVTLLALTGLLAFGLFACQKAVEVQPGTITLRYAPGTERLSPWGIEAMAREADKQAAAAGMYAWADLAIQLDEHLASDVLTQKKNGKNRLIVSNVTCSPSTAWTVKPDKKAPTAHFGVAGNDWARVSAFLEQSPGKYFSIENKSGVIYVGRIEAQEDQTLTLYPANPAEFAAAVGP